jgi:hypothetical protein
VQAQTTAAAPEEVTGALAVCVKRSAGAAPPPSRRTLHPCAAAQGAREAPADVAALHLHPAPKADELGTSVGPSRRGDTAHGKRGLADSAQRRSETQNEPPACRCRTLRWRYGGGGDLHRPCSAVRCLGCGLRGIRFGGAAQRGGSTRHPRHRRASTSRAPLTRVPLLCSPMPPGSPAQGRVMGRPGGSQRAAQAPGIGAASATKARC